MMQTKRILLLILSVMFLLLGTSASFAQRGTSEDFFCEEISDSLFARMMGKSYKQDTTIPRSELRVVHVLHYDFEGNIKQGEIICNKAICEDLAEIFKALYEEKYPIEKIRPVDDYDADDEKSMTDNNTSCFNWRQIAGTKKLSTHSQGLAIDINPLMNPMVKTRNGIQSVSPKAGKAFANRRKAFKGKIERNDLCYKLFKSHGFTWGGDWHSLKDYQHFEKTLQP